VKVRLCFHDRCFDGAASAAVFTRFYRERIRPSAEFHYTGMAHRATQPYQTDPFDGDENAIVDFKYSSSPKLTWWFDHHQSAFLTPEDAEHFRQDRSGRKFYGPEYKSCTKFLATVAREKFGFDPRPLEELIVWGDIIDGAQYPTPESAVRLTEPATRLALVVEAARMPDLVPRLIPKLAVESLADLARLPWIQDLLRPLLERHTHSIEVIRQRAEARDGVVFFDLSDEDLESYNKFIPYYLYPDCVYSVSVSGSRERAKVSVGSNPWNNATATKNLATLCEKYGGGGHARVAAISFESRALERARQVAQEIVATLRLSE